MKIKLLVSRVGPAGAQNRGDVIEVGDAEATRMIEAGQAEPVRGSAPETTAKASKGETAAARKGKARK